jgi:hypothetical protein
VLSDRQGRVSARGRELRRSSTHRCNR